ncbi:nicotinate-nucleotide--dimethylbenzimidazole phosphoribosyltransferase [Roseovarius sp. EL26]|uniref:nicotinate-nucleotide--dimethylbenzimidazole phosphoribosyltransferase n=1 Tax=Roseovarius sp. EL26 TaxID=2126672 RepID=UPI000EA24CC2|nr:nicotinate-nucleotide--dimethylbenzimidazole phosphoribosyltransferase [Roseovarius sp. EL26]
MINEFNTLNEFSELLRRMPEQNEVALAAAQARDDVLTKPPGALGRLEDLAAWYCAWRGVEKPRVKNPQVIVFAGNHGVTAQGISAFPAEVTVQMVANFQAGGAAVNQLAQAVDARMDVHALGLDKPTRDFSQGPAMSEAELVEALTIGWQAVDINSDILVVGEMGIGNTTSASAICCALYGGDAADWCGRGTGLDEAGVAHKAQVVATALDVNRSEMSNGLDVLRCLGGRELAAMVGAMLRARHSRIPLILDGFICCAAAACLAETQAGALDHTVAGHQSAEAAHVALLDRLGKEALLSLGMRLGEGSGATLAISVVKAALACHSGMATFAEAGVSDG